MTDMDLPHHALPGCEFKLALARHAGADALATYTGLAPIPDDMPQADADEMIAYVQQETHDAVVMLLGAKRLTGVVWLIESGQAALDLLASFSTGSADRRRIADYVPDGGEASTEAAMAEQVRVHPRSTLVIATAIVDTRASAAALS